MQNGMVFEVPGPDGNPVVVTDPSTLAPNQVQAALQFIAQQEQNQQDMQAQISNAMQSGQQFFVPNPNGAIRSR